MRPENAPVSSGLDLNPTLKAAVMPPGMAGPPSPSPQPPEPTMSILSRLKSEPVAFVGALQSLWLAILTLANVFEWWTWSDDQTAAVTGVWLAVTALVTYLVRGSVSPVPTSEADSQADHA